MFSITCLIQEEKCTRAANHPLIWFTSSRSNFNSVPARAKSDRSSQKKRPAVIFFCSSFCIAFFLLQMPVRRHSPILQIRTKQTEIQFAILQIHAEKHGYLHPLHRIHLSPVLNIRQMSHRVRWKQYQACEKRSGRRRRVFPRRSVVF